MSLDLAELDHNCNVVRRQIEEEFKNFTAMFIVHRTGERHKVLVSRKNQILAKPYGRRVFDTLSMTKNIQGEKSEFAGLIVNQMRLVGLFRKKHYTAIFFINADDFVVDKNAKHHLYHLVWHALNTYYDAVKEIEKTRKFQKTRIFKGEDNELKLSMNNLMADVFGAIMMETQGHEGYIQDLAEKRNTEVLAPIKDTNTDNFPYPVASDACQFVYDDLKESIDPKARLINQTMDIASEVASTYGQESLKEWWSFSKPAQQMAWMGYSPAQILGTAIYTSENTHVRALAYMIAESIEIETDATPEGVEYNPFVDDSINERSHNRVAEERFHLLLQQFEETENAALLLMEAKKQTAKLLSGIPTGWAAPALIQAMYAFEKASTKDIQTVRTHYYKTLQTLEWATIKKLAGVIIKIRKAGKEANEQALINILKNKKGFEIIADSLKAIAEIALPEKDDAQQETGVRQFVYDTHKAEQEKAG